MSISELEIILNAIETDKQIRSTVVEAYKTLKNIKKGGTILYINHSPNSNLRVNGGDAIIIPPQERQSIYDAKGKKELERILKSEDEDGAIEISNKGFINSLMRMFDVIADYVAAEIGLVDNPRKASYKHWGFKKRVFSRHKNTIAGTAKDPGMYGLTRSETTGDVRVMKEGKILYSPVPGEIHDDYQKILDDYLQNLLPTKTLYTQPSSHSHYASLPSIH